MSRQLLGMLTLTFLCACSNGRGSVAQAPSGEAPPPSAPSQPPTQPQPEPPAPAPTEPSPAPSPPAPTPTPSPSPEPVRLGFAGYWSGTVTTEGSNRERTGIAFVDPSGDAQLLVLRDDEEPEFVLHGNLCCEPRAEQKLAAQRYLETREHEAQIQAERSESGLTGALALRRDEYQFSLRPQAAYDDTLTLSALAGVYTRNVTRGPGAPWTMTLTIDGRGAITGSHSNGCVLNGTAALASDRRNLIRLNLEMSNCGGRDSSRRWNGSYQGFGVLLRNSRSPTDNATREDTLYFSLVGPTWLGPMSVGR